MFGLTKNEEKLLRRLSTPGKIQDFLDTLPMNHEKKGETHMSVRRVLREKKAHCIEGALVACAALRLQGEKPLLMDLRAKRPDDDHVIALYRTNGCWGAVSKTNHVGLRYRDPVYKTLRELALSYFHEWHFGAKGEKTLRSYSDPLDLRRFGDSWITAEEDLWVLDAALNALRHHPLVPPQNRRRIRNADAFARKIGDMEEWPERDPRT